MACRILGSQNRSSLNSSALTVNSYWALDWRPPMRMSCTGTKKSLAPAFLANLILKRATT